MCLRDTCFPPAPLGQWKTSAQRSCHLAGCARVLSLLQPPVTPQPHGGWSPTFLLDEGGEISLPGASLPSQGNALGRFLHLLSCSTHWADGLLCPTGRLEEKPSPPGVCTVTKPCCISGHLLHLCGGYGAAGGGCLQDTVPIFLPPFLDCVCQALGKAKGRWLVRLGEETGVAVLISTVLAHGRCQAEGPGQGGKKGEREKQQYLKYCKCSKDSNSMQSTMN